MASHFFIISVLFATTHYTAYSYIEPFLGRIADMSPETVTITLIIFGASGMLGSIAFGKLYMAHRYGFILTVTVGTVIALLLLLPSAASVASVVLVCVAWGAMATAFNIAFQDNTIRFAPENATSIAMSIFSGIYNLGIGSGAYIGGLVVTHASLEYIGYAAGTIGIIALAYCLLRLFPNMRRSENKMRKTVA